MYRVGVCVCGCHRTYLDSAGNALVFSLDIVFSYNRVERR